MRILFVVQRYGHEVAGGAETFCREFATRLAGRGHDVEVLTTTARDYRDWANHYPPGASGLDGVVVHRLPVEDPRDFRFFGPLNARVVWSRGRPPLHLQERWMRAQGPWVPSLPAWLAREARGYAVVVFVTYLYYTTWAGLPVAAGLVPTVLHPTAHDEPALHLDLYRTMFRHPSAFAFLTVEERHLVETHFALKRPSAVVGVGVELDRAGDGGAAFRAAHGLGDRPYLAFVGRVDEAKGSEELLDLFAAYKRRNPGPLALAVIGDPVRGLERHPDVIPTGFVTESLKDSALSGALALAQPSYFESFSMVLTEAWVHRTPAVVQGHCDVLAGQCRRAGGGLPYRGFAEFEAVLNRLLDDPVLGERLGAAGRSYVEAHYAWDAVLDPYERFLAGVAKAAPARSAG